MPQNCKSIPHCIYSVKNKAEIIDKGVEDIKEGFVVTVDGNQISVQSNT